ncbi:unnamed protein product [Coregonus sp. 'balchen']|nr:unnamed protein product [Coregonus sp. 'balchen']
MSDFERLLQYHMDETKAPSDTDKTICVNDDCFTRKENKDLTNLKGEDISTEVGHSDWQMDGQTREGVKDKPAVVEYLLTSACQVTGDIIAHMQTVKALLKWLTVQVRMFT